MANHHLSNNNGSGCVRNETSIEKCSVYDTTKTTTDCLSCVNGFHLNDSTTPNSCSERSNTIDKCKTLNPNEDNCLEC